MVSPLRIVVPLACLLALVGACEGDGFQGNPNCGPATATVSRVIDGDTVELDSGERVRYLMIDAPENTTDVECYGPETTAFNRDLVEGKEVELIYGEQCTDNFGRLLAFVSVSDREVNSILVERGFACVLFIPPNGESRREEFEDLELRARTGDFGLWGTCETRPC